VVFCWGVEKQMGREIVERDRDESKERDERQREKKKLEIFCGH
jgi:hypothetical protein